MLLFCKVIKKKQKFNNSRVRTQIGSERRRGNKDEKRLIFRERKPIGEIGHKSILMVVIKTVVPKKREKALAFAVFKLNKGSSNNSTSELFMKNKDLQL